jgi:hypothetical protein
VCRYFIVLFNVCRYLLYNSLCVAGISGEKVEIDPVASKSGTKLFRQKPVTYEADSIASCDMIEEKDGGNYLLDINRQ